METLSIEKKIKFNEPMKKHTSFKIGGNADYFVNVNSENELKDAIEFSKRKNIPIYFIGNGSNILVTDKGIRGIVVKIELNKIEIKREKEYIKIVVGAGIKIMALAQILAKEEIAGFEEISGIPGTIGGAIFMNAGAYGKEMKDIVVSTKYMDLNGNVYEISNEEQEFSYRSSIFNKKNYIILETTLKLQYGNKEKINLKMKEFLNSRKEKQPIEFPSAGSSFKRKEGVITAKIIDECGLKGYKIGGAMISDKHAGFIINFNNAKAKDVLDLIKYVKEKVLEKYGICIEEEIKILGEE